MTSETFQSFWYGELSSREQLCLTSFVDQGKNFELYTYDDLSVPDGVILKDASEIYPEEEVFAYQSGPGEGSVAAFSDFFRYKLLYERGGWWVDLDVLYTGEKIPNDDVYFGWANQSYIGNAIMKFTKDHEKIQKIYDKARLVGKEKAADEWGKAGPKLVTSVLEEEGMSKKAKEVSRVYPITWREAAASYLPDMRSTIQERVGGGAFLHLWNEILGRMGIHKDVRPPRGSYLSKCAKELNFVWPCSEVQYSAATIKNMAKNWQTSQGVNSNTEEVEEAQSSSTLNIAAKIEFIRQKIGF